MMTELSLNVLDIAQNSIHANASFIQIAVAKNTADQTLTITISDNGCGMTEKQVHKVTDPFYTSRTTRKVGLGVPFFKESAEMTGGSFEIKSVVDQGTVISAFYHYDNIDMLPLGSMADTMAALIGMNPNIDFFYQYSVDRKSFVLDTREMKKVLQGVPIESEEVLTFIRSFITQNQAETDNES